MSFHQQRMAAISKHKLLAVVVKDAHILDAAIEIGYIVSGILGIFAVAIDLVLVLQQLGVLHPMHIGTLIGRSDG